MMSGYEETLYSRAEMLDETSDLAAEATEVLDGASGAGVDPAAVTSLRAAVQALDPAEGAPAYDANRPGIGYRSDVEFLGAVTDAEDQVRERLRDAGTLRGDAGEAMDKAQDDLGRSRRDLQNAQMALAAACALPTKDPCEGCHSAKAAAIMQAEQEVADAEQAIADASRRISTLGGALEILDALILRLTAAAQALRQVPADLGETYELIANLIRDGGQMTHDGRFVTGEGDMPVGGRRPKDQRRLRNTRSDHDDRSSMNGTPPASGTQLPAGPEAAAGGSSPEPARRLLAVPRLTTGQRWLAGGVVALGLTLTPIAFGVMYVNVTGLLRPDLHGGAWAVPVGTEVGFTGLFLAELLLEWIGKPLRWLPVLEYLLAAASIVLNAIPGWGTIAGVLGHEALPIVFFGYLIVGKATVRRLAVSDEAKRHEVALADAQAHARDMLRSALGIRWRMKAPLMLRRQLRSGRLPARVLEAVETGSATEWEDAVETWIAAAVTLPERTREVLRAARAEASARPLPDPSESPSAGTPETPSGTPSEDASASTSDAPSATPPAAPSRTAPKAPPKAPPKPRRLIPSKASDDDLAELIIPLLADGEVSPTKAVKVIREAAGGKASIGHDRAKTVIALAQEQANRVVPIGERRQA
jgi:hypothetical protein